MWCLRTESNHRHGDFQSPALPTELQRQTFLRKNFDKSFMATWMGLEPTTSAVTGRRSNQLNYQARLCAELCISSAQFGGNNRARTYDPLLVRQMLSQLSYAPKSYPIFQGCFVASDRFVLAAVLNRLVYSITYSGKSQGFFQKKFRFVKFRHTNLLFSPLSYAYFTYKSPILYFSPSFPFISP